jgi:hypothetical protein
MHTEARYIMLYYSMPALALKGNKYFSVQVSKTKTDKTSDKCELRERTCFVGISVFGFLEILSLFRKSEAL